jgi:hypothetical protein
MARTYEQVRTVTCPPSPIQQQHVVHRFLRQPPPAHAGMPPLPPPPKPPPPCCRPPAHPPALLQELAYITQLSPYHYSVAPGFVPGMTVPGVVYVNQRLQGLLFDELQAYCQRGGQGGFLPAVKQIANVAALPGIVKVCGGRSGTAAACLRVG